MMEGIIQFINDSLNNPIHNLKSMRTLTLLILFFVGANFPVFSFEKEARKVIEITAPCDSSGSYDIDSIVANPRVFMSNFSSIEGKQDSMDIMNLIDNCPSIKLLIKKEALIKRFISLAYKLKLPYKSKIIEFKSLSDRGMPDRAIIYWIENPRVFISCLEEDEYYDCGNSMIGLGQYFGKIKFSLINTNDSTIINTLDLSNIDRHISENGELFKETQECMETPFCSPNKSNIHALCSRIMYNVIGGDSISEGLSEILYLDDYNGDGDALEFAIYLSGDCMTCESALFGYSKKQDRLIKFEFDIKQIANDSAGNEIIYNISPDWLGYTFSMKFKNKKLKYQIDYRGRGGCLDKFDLEYDSEHEIFRGVEDIRQIDLLEGEEPLWISEPEE